MAKPEIGKIGIWNFFDQQSTAQISDIVKELEAMGWPAIWIPEAMGRDSMVNASLILSATTKLKVATGIAQLHARHPMTMAASQKSLSEAYNNRFVLGIGVSHEPFVAGIRGLSYEKPLTQTREYILAMKEAPYVAPEPSQVPPLLVAALGPKMLALSAELADGAHPYNTLPVHTEQARKIIGKDAFLAPELKVILETDPEVARTAARNSIGFYMELPNYVNNFLRMGFSEEDIETVSDKFVDGLFAWGDMDTIKDRIQQHLDAGADHVAIQVVPTNNENRAERQMPMEEWKALAEACL